MYKISNIVQFTFVSFSLLLLFADANGTDAGESTGQDWVYIYWTVSFISLSLKHLTCLFVTITSEFLVLTFNVAVTE